MKKKTILAVPAGCFWSVIEVCVAGIVAGTFCDLDISRALANKTELGTYFATYSPFFAYCLFPAGGACLYAGLRKKGKAWKDVGVLLVAFALVCIFVLLCGYNRIHMTNHFLSDVCFGVLIVSMMTAGICTVFLKAADDRG